MARPTETMVKALREAEEYGDPTWSAYGMSARGGRSQTVDALITRGLLTSTMRDATPEEKADDPTLARVQEWHLTDAGREVLAAQPVRWYCHTCGRTHTHTAAQRDEHRDDLRRREATRIDAAR